MARPRLHFNAQQGWINDPYGVTFRDGVYHLFFQYVPDSTEWQQHCHWGHATSPDLLTWTEQPVALAPAGDETGCWSGCVVDGQMFYTSVHADDLGNGAVRVATALDNNWQQWQSGEVLLRRPSEALPHFRDPFIIANPESGNGNDKPRWLMLMGAGDDTGIASVQSYTSDDLVTFDYAGPLLERSGTEQDPWTGVVWECPQLVRCETDQGPVDVLVVSVWDQDTRNVMAAVGSLREGRFDVRRWQQLAAEPGGYAASAFTDADGEPCLIFWLRGIFGDGWTGAESVPFRVSVTEDHVMLTPIPALAARRRVTSEPAAAMDLEWSGDGTLRLGNEVRIIRAHRQLTVESGEQRMSTSHEAATVRVLVDGPILEVLADGGLVALGMSGAPFTPEIEAASGELQWWALG